MINIIEDKIEDGFRTTKFTYKIGNKTCVFLATANYPSKEALRNLAKTIFKEIKL